MEIDADQSVDRFALCISMVFAYTDQPLVMTIYNPICISQFSFRGDRSRMPSRILAIKALIDEIGEVNSSILDSESSAAILVYPGSGIEWRMSYVGYLPFRGTPHDDAPAAFCRSHLDPVDIISYTHLRAHETVLELVCR